MLTTRESFIAAIVRHAEEGALTTHQLATILANYIGSDDLALWLEEISSKKGPFSKGTQYVTLDGKRGTLTGYYEPCFTQGCPGTRLNVEWPNGNTTNMCTASIKWCNDHWERKYD